MKNLIIDYELLDPVYEYRWAGMNSQILDNSLWDWVFKAKIDWQGRKGR
jgi:hypothetical protein